MLSSLVVALLASCGGAFFEQPGIDGVLSRSEEVIELRQSGSRTYDLQNGSFMTVVSNSLFDDDFGLASEDQQSRSSASGSLKDRAFIVDSETIDDGDASFTLGKTNVIGAIEWRAAYEIVLPEIDYRALTSATLAIRGTSSGSLSSVNCYSTDEDYSHLDGKHSYSMSYVSSSSYTASNRFILDILSPSTDTLFNEIRTLNLIVSGNGNNATRTMYSVESNYSPTAIFVYDAPTVSGVGAATPYVVYPATTHYNMNCFAYAMGYTTNESLDFPDDESGNWYPLTESKMDDEVVPTLQKHVGRNLNLHIRRLSSRTASIYSYEWRIVFRAGWVPSFDQPSFQVHFMKQTATGFGQWAEKFPWTSSTLFPAEIIPDYSIWPSYCTSQTIYFAVSN